jgi:riboflavin biosynthesis pyrimidine reductase
MADGEPDPLTGLGELASLGRLRPASVSVDPVVGQAVAELAAIYAHQPPGTAPERAAGTTGGLAPSGALGVRPWVRANMVTSVDGAGSLHGRSGGLSGPADRLVFSVLRSLADVILVGAGTARAERYGQVRPDSAWSHLRTSRPVTPPIAVVTRGLDLDLSGPLFTGGAGLARTIVLTTQAAPPERLAATARSAQVIVVGEESVTVTAAISALAAAGYQRILTEGGPTLLAQLVAEDLLDDLCLTISPVMAGGQATRILRPSSAGGIAEIATGLSLVSVLQDGGYLLLRYVRQRAD